jgi:hypothetical protein
MPVRPDLVVTVEPTLPLVPPVLEDAVVRCWEAAQQRAGGRLFDGTVFSVTRLGAGEIAARAVPYRLAVAAYADPSLAAALDIRPLAVCGVLRMRDGVLFGRRQTGATYEAGLWQMPPAGSVDPSARRGSVIDAEAMIRDELREEIGLSWDRVSGCRPFCVVTHPGSLVHDLGFVMATEAGFAEVQALAAALPVAEYSELVAVPDSELAAFLDARKGQVVPTALLFLEELGLVSRAS